MLEGCPLIKNRRRFATLSAISAATLALSGCSAEAQRGFLPDSSGVTNHTDSIIGLWTSSWIVLLAVGVLSWGLIAWALIVYRRRKGETGMPAQLRYNNPIEILFTVIPLFLVIGFFAFTARDMAAIEQPIENPDVTVQVIGKQWSWDFNYVDENVYYSGIQAQFTGTEENIMDTLSTSYQAWEVCFTVARDTSLTTIDHIVLQHTEGLFTSPINPYWCVLENIHQFEVVALHHLLNYWSVTANHQTITPCERAYKVIVPELTVTPSFLMATLPLSVTVCPTVDEVPCALIEK